MDETQEQDDRTAEQIAYDGQSRYQKFCKAYKDRSTVLEELTVKFVMSLPYVPYTPTNPRIIVGNTYS